VTLSPELREFAEDPTPHTTLGPGFRRWVDDAYVLFLGPVAHFTAVSSVRTGDVGATLDEIRTLIREHGHTRATWWIGPSSRPHDLRARLLELGLRVPEGRVADLVALATDEPPAPAPADVRVTPIETVEDYATGSEIRWDAFGTAPAQREAERAHLAESFRLEHEGGGVVSYLAHVDGRPAAFATGAFGPRGCLLVGGATAEWARGRGAYRALVRARWDESSRRGAPALVAQAAPGTSAPILRALGFQEVCRLTRLEDPL
jgi:hypothetical protein